jgi:hypothetical protein
MEPLQPRWVIKLGGKKILKAPKMVVGTDLENQNPLLDVKSPYGLASITNY